MGFVQLVIDRARLSRLMDAEDLDIVLASSEKNFGYLSGYIHPFSSDYIPVNDIGEPDVHYAGVPREQTKDPFMVQNSYASFLERREPWIKDRRYYGSGVGEGMDRFDLEQPIKMVAESLKERGLEKARIGLELEQRFAMTKDTMKVPIMQQLKKFLPKATFVEGGEVIMKARMIKSPGELQNIKKAVKASEKAFSVAFESARVGMTEIDLLKVVKRTLAEQNAMHAFTLVEFFPSKVKFTGGKFYTHATENKLETGDIIGMDMGGAVDYYSADMIRNKLIGSPKPGLSQEWVDLYPAVLEADRAAASVARPGAKASDLFEAGKKSLKATGHKLMVESVGHANGLSLHEPPYLTATDSTVLEPGMVFSIEPAIFLKGLSLVIVEDMIHITKRGYEEISTMDRQLT
jgi:Xaa-Pro aminopeptidase